MDATAGTRFVFSYKCCDIDKTQSLGRGSYGTVYKASCDELPCAAKILHPTIVHSLDPGARRIMERFEKECNFLGNMRHPHIVQYLGVFWDNESKLPALFMELLDESLTAMLERLSQPPSFGIQVDICHDIALALAYLHSNDIIHRDLSSNNVLVVAGRRAKVSDFGMVKLSRSASPMFTTIPGTYVYMPPEAWHEPLTYSTKLDCFSKGVIIIQMCSQQFPNPGPRTQRKISLESPTGSVEVPVLETDRRKNHIDLIEPNNPLLPIAIDCLHYDADKRPSAAQLCQRMAQLKRDDMYANSNQKRIQDDKNDQKILEVEVDPHRFHELQQELEKQDEIIRDLQQRNDELQMKLDTLNMSLNLPSSATNVVLNWREVHSASPFKMIRGSAVVDEDIVYFMNTGGDVCAYNSITYEWHVVPGCPLFGSSLAVVNDLVTAVGGEELVGNKPSKKLLSLVNKDGEKKWVPQDQFEQIPTPRNFPAVVCIKSHLIVAGGKKGRNYGQTYLNSVEIMNTENGRWSTAARLPYPYSRMSMTVCRDRIYMLGGFGLTGRVRSVISCSVDALLGSTLWSNWIRSGIAFRPVWQLITKIPTYHFATCVTVKDELFALGGCLSTDETVNTNRIHKFNTNTKSWEQIGVMPRSVERCLAVVLPTNELMVVGGGVSAQHDQGSNAVSIANIADQ